MSEQAWDLEAVQEGMEKLPMTFGVTDKTLNEMLGIARHGEKQLVAFEEDELAMAKQAAAVSKEACGEIIEKLLEVMSN